MMAWEEERAVRWGALRGPLTRTLCVGILLFLVAGAWTVGARADTGIDAVLVIDSSGSMKETDPRRLRVPAAKLFLSLLGPDDRVGLISFSDDGYPVLHMTPAGNANRARLSAAAEKVSAKGAYTNLHAALARGHDMLGREGRAERRRMLVLMSDGKMDTGDFEQDQALLARIRNELLPALAQDGIEVYTIAFTEASDLGLMREMAERTAAMSRLASNDRELHAVFGQIFETAKQPDAVPIEGGAFKVDAAVQELTVVASKAAADVNITLEMPDGRSLSARQAGDAVRWFQSEQFDMITVERPAAGNWRLRSSDGRGDRAYVVTDLRLEGNVGDIPIYADVEQEATAWLHEGGEVIAKPEILGQTRFSLEISPPDGEAYEIALADAGASGDRAAGDGVFGRLLSFAAPGEHQVRILARNPNFERAKVLLVDVVAPSIQVIPEPEPIAAPDGPIALPPIIEETIVEDPEPADSANVGLLVSLFVLVNILIGAAIAGVLFWRNRRAPPGPAGDAAEHDEK